MALSVGSGRSEAADTRAAVAEAIERARAGLAGAQPEFAFVTCTVDHDAKAVFAAVREALPRVQIHGITTSLGVLAADGVTMGTKGVVGVLLARGDGSTFVSSSASYGDDAKGVGAKVAKALAARAGGRRPTVLLFNASPGVEEELLEGVASVFPGVPAYGGSAADHAIAGDWYVFTDEGAVRSGLTLTAVFGVRTGAAFAAPYEPTGDEVRVTASAGRRIARLGDRPAAEVLREWVGDAIAPQAVAGGNILAQTALSPLGVRHDGTSGPHYIAVHPAHIQPDGAVDVFARTPEGTTVCRMRGTEAGLIDALPGLLQRALSDGGMTAAQVKAAFLIYCAGCAGSVGDRLHEGLRRHYGDPLGRAAMIGVCTFGEQGCLPGVGNVHSNLSVGLVLLGD